MLAVLRARGMLHFEQHGNAVDVNIESRLPMIRIKLLTDSVYGLVMKKRHGPAATTKQRRCQRRRPHRVPLPRRRSSRVRPPRGPILLLARCAKNARAKAAPEIHPPRDPPQRTQRGGRARAMISAARPSRSFLMRRRNAAGAQQSGSYSALQRMISSIAGVRARPLSVR